MCTYFYAYKFTKTKLESVHTNTLTYIHTCIHTCTKTHLHAYIHTYMCMFIHTHRHTHTYIHTYILPKSGIETSSRDSKHQDEHGVVKYEPDTHGSIKKEDMHGSSKGIGGVDGRHHDADSGDMSGSESEDEFSNDESVAPHTIQKDAQSHEKSGEYRDSDRGHSQDDGSDVCMDVTEAEGGMRMDDCAEAGSTHTDNNDVTVSHKESKRHRDRALVHNAQQSRVEADHTTHVHETGSTHIEGIQSSDVANVEDITRLKETQSRRAKQWQAVFDSMMDLPEDSQFDQPRRLGAYPHSEDDAVTGQMHNNDMEASMKNVYGDYAAKKMRIRAEREKMWEERRDEWDGGLPPLRMLEAMEKDIVRQRKA
jgi:hypothetical protein